MAEISSGGGIPVIDLQDFPRQSEKLIAACEDWGCFRVTNHGIPSTLLSEVKAVAESLLDLPVETKQKTADAVVNRGYFATQVLDSLGLYDTYSPQAFGSFCDNLNASPHQRETLQKYCQAVKELIMDIGSKVVEAMGLVINDLLQGWPCQFRMLKYNFTPDTIGSNGAMMHTDLSFFTILQDDECVGGLELLDKKTDTLVDVKPLPGTLLVVLGDFAKVWSNGRFCNVKHRVQNKDGRKRISIATFVLGPRNEKVEAPIELVGSNRPRLYVPLDIEEYRMLRTSTKSPTGEALELFRITNTMEVVTLG